MAASTKEAFDWMKQLRHALDIQKTQAVPLKTDSSILIDDDDLHDADD
jgi:hypothetical protein